MRSSPTTGHERSDPNGVIVPPLVAGDVLGRRGVGHRQPAHAEQGAELGPADGAISGDEDEEKVVLPTPDDDRLHDGGRLDPARRGRLGEGAHRPVTDDLVPDSGRRQRIQRLPFSHGAGV
jgi:hypothetical protein